MHLSFLSFKQQEEMDDQRVKKAQQSKKFIETMNDYSIGANQEFYNLVIGLTHCSS
jgi:hypothetical protein